MLLTRKLCKELILTEKDLQIHQKTLMYCYKIKRYHALNKTEKSHIAKFRTRFVF